MKYFELFGIPVSLVVNKQDLSKRFFELSRQLHPDYFANAMPSERAASLDKSAMLNRAYKTLTHPDETIKYVLNEKGLLHDEEKSTLPPEFLMEMLDINEQMTEAKLEGNEAAMQKLSASIDLLQNDIYAPVKNIVENYREGFTTMEELMKVKEYYMKKRYLWRLRSQLT